MKVITKATLDLCTMQWLPELEESYEYSGPLALCDGGASGAAKANETAQNAFYDSMTNEQSTTFGESQDILSNLKNTWTPVLAAGPYQYGFSTGEDATLRGDIVNAGQIAETNTENAALTREQQESGGASTMPTGGQAAVNAQVAAEGAQATAASLSKEKLAGYQQGSNLFAEASNALDETAQLENPVGTANATTGAGTASTGAINLVDTENANSTLNKVIGGAIGGADAFAGGAGAMATKMALA
jgi:hypothetical protein